MGPSFKIVKDLQGVPSSPEWRDSATPTDKFKIYKNHKYTIISAKERDYSSLERIGRIALGVIAVAGTLGFGLINKDYREFVAKLFTKETKTVHFGVISNQTTESFITYLEGKTLTTVAEKQKQFSFDYPGLQGKGKDGKPDDPRIKIDNKTIALPDIPGMEGRSIVNHDLYPTTLVDIFPEGIKSYFDKDFSSKAPILALLLQQGVVTPFAEEAPNFIPDPIPDTIYFFDRTMPHYELSKAKGEIFILIKLNGYLAEGVFETHQREYKSSMLINLTNLDAPIEMTYTEVTLWERIKEYVTPKG